MSMLWFCGTLIHSCDHTSNSCNQDGYWAYMRRSKDILLDVLWTFYVRSSHRRCCIKKVVFKKFEIFTGKDLCWSPFLIKLQAFKPTSLLKRDYIKVVFQWIFKKENLRTSILKNTRKRLLLILCLVGTISGIVNR